MSRRSLRYCSPTSTSFAVPAPYTAAYLLGDIIYVYIIYYCKIITRDVRERYKKSEFIVVAPSLVTSRGSGLTE